MWTNPETLPKASLSNDGGAFAALSDRKNKLCNGKINSVNFFRGSVVGSCFQETPCSQEVRLHGGTRLH